MRRKKGFTLIELLVVITIIGILGAMLFPVFARARESARGAICLNNIKQVCLAMLMYLNDYDETFPAAVTDDPTGVITGPDDVWQAEAANPWQRWMVKVDPYIRNRDVWNCPSAKIVELARAVNHIISGNDVDCFGNAITPDQYPFPCDWSGVRLSIGLNCSLRGQRLAVVTRPANHALAFDCTKPTAPGLDNIVFADNCAADCMCPSTWVYPIPWPPEIQANGSVAGFTEWIEDNAMRHTGGSNIGYIDGHVKYVKGWGLIQAVRKGHIDGLGDGVTGYCGLW